MNVHFVVYSALIKIMNSVRDVFPTVLLMIFARVFCSFSIMSGCYPKFAEDYFNSLILIRLGRLYQYQNGHLIFGNVTLHGAGRNFILWAWKFYRKILTDDVHHIPCRKKRVYANFHLIFLHHVPSFTMVHFWFFNLKPRYSMSSALTLSCFIC